MSLIPLFSNETLIKVLSLFLLNPENEFYQTSVVRQTGKALMQVQRALKKIEETGLISSERRGNMIFYHAERSHPAFEDLKKLFLKTVGFGDFVRQALEPLHEKIEFAFIFGSVAAGNESAESDIDLLVVADISAKQLAKVLGPLSRSLNREFNPVLFQPEDFREKCGDGHHFIVEVLKKPRIWLFGREHELKKLGKRWAA